MYYWDATMYKPNFPPNRKEAYEKGIKHNLDALEYLDLERRKEFGNFLYPEKWLQRPTYECYP
jgi:hypothetical protein